MSEDTSSVIHIRLGDNRTKRLVRWLSEAEDMDVTEWINSLINERIAMLTTTELAAFDAYWQAASTAARRAKERGALKKDGKAR